MDSEQKTNNDSNDYGRIHESNGSYTIRTNRLALI
jgi:hypothetical protein